MVMVVIADVRAIVIAAATAPIAIGPTVAITSTIAIAAVIAITIAAMIAIPIARHAHHAIAIRTTASVWSPMKANAAATGDQRDIGRGSR